ncbi:coiled-coil domain-containing protein 22 homolog [Bombyx mandarina]|uniref:Coiled-coil domain-containing protein 22 homolog n=1 Tax=Bombyx mandarina TaxID=7092 RepID=A0A6J2K7L6_BOMMA|nr:coiled-coil domain-containing protein 22 homolog [Bombyx mandarina]
MEEVDSIILHFLRQLNLKIDDNVKNMCDVSVEFIIEAASKCLNAINPSLKVPQKLPKGISHRIEVAAQIASFCKDLGYKNDVGYQTFLYYNEAELRQVFMFLIERLPNEGKQSSVSASLKTNQSTLMKDVSNKISEEMEKIWVPHCCKPNEQQKGITSTKNNVHLYNTLENEKDLIQKLIHIQEMNTNSRDTKAQDVVMQKESKLKTEAFTKEHNKTLKELKETAIVLRQKLDTLESERNVMNVEYSQAQVSCEKVEDDLKNVINILNSIGITDENSEGVSDEVLEKVQKNINKLHAKSEDLTSKSLSLKAEIENVKQSMNRSESERNKYKNMLGYLKESAKAMKEEYGQKEHLRNQLKLKYEKLRGGNKRSIYTKRIVEIISNVDKQNIEIKKILEDTRQLQKEINILEGQLERSFSVADETLFRDAKKDDQAKKAYKLLALLHSECKTIVSLVNDIGSLQRDIVDLEENVKTETAKRTEDTLEKIKFDIAKIKEET